MAPLSHSFIEVFLEQAAISFPVGWLVCWLVVWLVCKKARELCSFPWQAKRLAKTYSSLKFQIYVVVVKHLLHGNFSNKPPCLKMNSKMQVCFSSYFMIKFPGEVCVSCWLQWKQHTCEGKIHLMDWLIVSCLVLLPAIQRHLAPSNSCNETSGWIFTGFLWISHTMCK